MEKGKSKSLALWISGILLLSPLLYLLSFGPASWLAYAGHLSDEAVSRGYGPILRTAANQRGSIESLTLWYAGLAAPEHAKPRLSVRSFEIEAGSLKSANAVDVVLRWDGGPSLDNVW